MEEPLILDRYRPLADLGSGGHGSVVLAFDTKMARRVAIKRLPLPSAGAASRVGLAEARTAALLNHPDIVTVHEWDTDSDEAFIVMEDIDGASVADLLDETGQPLTLDEVAAVLAAVTSALAFAHGNGVLHLDLKPANVLVARDGRVKVADFGVSALTDSSGRARGTAGTIGYMPPEQLRGQALDERTDGWALAALAYELLTNANPFDAETAEGSLFKIEVADLPAPSEFEPDLPDAVDDILIAALAPDPDERYDTAQEFFAALGPYLGDVLEGRRSLAEVVSGLEPEEAEEEIAWLGLWDRLAPYAGWARRVASALGSGWLAWAGTSALHAPGGVVPVATLLVALAAALAPGLGLALGFAAFAIGMGVALGLAAGVVFFGLAAGFWWLNGRHGALDGLAPLFGPLLGTVRGATAMPLLLGFVFEPLPAAVASAAAALATASVSAATGHGAPLLATGTRFFAGPFHLQVARGEWLARMLDPGVAIAVLAWAASGAVCSLLCRRATRGGGLLGVVLGALALVAGYAGWRLIGGASVPAFAPDLTVGAAIGIAAAALGAPTRGEEP